MRVLQLAENVEVELVHLHKYKLVHATAAAIASAMNRMIAY